MRTGLDVLRSVHRYAWKTLGDEWETRYWGVEGELKFPFARVSALTAVETVGPASIGDLTRTYRLDCYPAPLGDPEMAIMQAEAVEEMLHVAFEIGFTYQDPLDAPYGLAHASAPVGGGLAAGSYYYRVTAVAAGGESLPSAEHVAAVTGSTSVIVLAWNAVQGATSYRVYRGVAAGAETRLAQVTDAMFSDDGSFSPGVAIPPTSSAVQVNVQSAKKRIPLYDWDGVPLDGVNSVSNKRGPHDYAKVVSCPINRLVDPEDDGYWLVTAEPRVTWRRVGRVPSGHQIVQSVHLTAAGS